MLEYKSRYVPGQKNLVVFDLDGVLFDSEHRFPLWEAGKHEEYFQQVEDDKPLSPGITICSMFVANPKFEVIFVTGRGAHQTHRNLTLYMLRYHINPYINGKQLLMREWPMPDPYDHDTVKKPKMIEAAGYSLDDIFMVFEDRNSIVDMWRARGVTTYHTQIGDF
jgi:FMN phosphatase YigB (HAD superfamily)